MVKLDIERVALHYHECKGRGFVWANNQLMVVPPAWSPLEGEERKKGWTLLWYPEEDKLERIDFYRVGHLTDFVYLSYEVMLRMEPSSQIPERPDDVTTLPGWIDIDEEFVDQQLEDAEFTDSENPYLQNFSKFLRQNTPAAKYARTEKGKLARKKWRQSPQAIVAAQKRREDKKVQNRQFREIEAWLVANPGKSFQDYALEQRS